MVDQPSQSEAILSNFMDLLASNKLKAQQKKQLYLQRIMQIFKQFVSKCEKQIDRIIQKKLSKLENNYEQLLCYLQYEHHITQEEQQLIVTEFLVKPFEKFPFSGNKNEKIFQEQYNLIEKASLLIEQTLVDSFNEEEIPNFQNKKFFDTLNHNGVGEQSLVKLHISPQNLALEPKADIVPLQVNRPSSRKMLNP